MEPVFSCPITWPYHESQALLSDKLTVRLTDQHRMDLLKMMVALVWHSIACDRVAECTTRRATKLEQNPQRGTGVARRSSALLGAEHEHN